VSVAAEADRSVGVRLPPLDGSRNFRDLGGYSGADGRRVRWGRLYRSGTLAGLTVAGHAQLRALGIGAVCDLRTSAERAGQPYDWCAAAGMVYWSRDYATSFGELRAVLGAALPSAAAARAAMMNGYRELPYEQAPAYRELFRMIGAGALPLVFNCSAGKDRAGTAAALVLSALGVPRDRVIEDYRLTDTVWDYRVALGDHGRESMVARQPWDVVEAVYTADPAYIGAALDAIVARSGSLAAYLDDVLDVDADRLAAIRSNLLE
jgi:protein-tyrosine phosphatase